MCPNSPRHPEHINHFVSCLRIGDSEKAKKSMLREFEGIKLISLCWNANQFNNASIDVETMEENDNSSGLSVLT